MSESGGGTLMIGEMFYIDIDEGKWQYELNTDPPEAIYWKQSSYKLRLKDIKIVTKCEPEVRKRLKYEIIKDIEKSENNVGS
jgi:hypothetical protein